jgi:hypothetical protein
MLTTARKGPLCPQWQTDPLTTLIGRSAPIPVVREAAIEPLGSTRTIPSGSREHGSPLREAGKAQAGDEEFENFWCRKVSVLAIAGDGQLGVDGEHSEPAEMGIGGNFGPHRCDHARLLVQGTVGPFDCLFEAPRREMSERNIKGVEKGIRIERTQRRGRDHTDR